MGQRLNRGNRSRVLHYITLNVREKRRPFQRDLYARLVLEELGEHCRRHPAKLIAYVVMPTHLHAILNPRDGDIIHFLQQYKAGVTTAVYHLAQATNHLAATTWLTATPDGHAQLWQDGRHNLHLYSEWMIWQKINYIHNNPAKNGLVQHADEYLYSSFNAMYHPEKETLLPIDRDWWWTDLPILP